MYDVIRCRFSSVVSLFLLSLLGGCGSSTTPSLTSAQSEGGTPPPALTSPGLYPQVLHGWLPEYSSFVETKVSDVYPALLSISPPRLSLICPNWAQLDRREREKFWSTLLYAIASRESGHLRTSIYRETTMSIDAVTGQQIRSEGLLQLSYVDVVNYRFPSGEISWENDRTMALNDYAAGRKSGYPERTILNAYANLNLGIFIMNRLAAIHPSQILQAAFGRYWHTMRSTSGSFPKVVGTIKAKMPDCF